MLVIIICEINGLESRNEFSSYAGQFGLLIESKVTVNCDTLNAKIFAVAESLEDVFYLKTCEFQMRNLCKDIGDIVNDFVRIHVHVY